jgi:hypothetical protein
MCRTSPYNFNSIKLFGWNYGSGVVRPSFTIIRQSYGKLFFEGPLDVSNVNLDEIGMFFKLLIKFNN